MKKTLSFIKKEPAPKKTLTFVKKGKETPVKKTLILEKIKKGKPHVIRARQSA